MAKPEAFDDKPWVLNCQNGGLNLKTGELRPHRRKDYLMTMAPTEYQPEADCPTWLGFVNDITAGDEELQRFLRRAVGMSLAGVIQDHVLLFCYGKGANGKSTFLGAIQDMLGPDYAMKATHNLPMAKRSDSHSTEIADLAGKRFVACIESGEGRKLAESLAKELSGGDKIRARRMREDNWEFTPSHTLWFGANHKPVIRGTDDGIWRRMRLIPFTVQIPESQQDRRLPEKLKAEASGILNWATLGLAEWQSEGLGQPEAVVAATREYRDESDVVGSFIAEYCDTGEGREEAAKELYGAYRKWTEDSRERPMTQRTFGLTLGERGYVKDRFTMGTLNA